ncbi:hypothetical protein [Aliivibrio sifiae]|uniref:hypothetical protein n=1 Tax=Aliivibrio sifiae TaxID=566293 RepID=UPI000CF3F495|nr:hypothetical protein [Aliivibrio sifiae]
MDISTILGSAVVAGIVAGIVTLRISERKISIENVTQQRQEWREKIRKLALNICSAYSSNETHKVKNYYVELQLLLNPDDNNDIEILDTVWKMHKGSEDHHLDIELSEKLALLLKHDWERAKSEAQLSIFRIVGTSRISYQSFKQKHVKNERS